ncbi:hypothetical protein [Acidovorax sp. CCYZU-2555]|jgi:ElaB/YqjD/DUF883 family membrane-anchored ribosome-binding protein|uniref:hypothetical protein n=1 Tax=Acidovorax sp. CCYZU-2555 TaxID=2835042 RepID=UPI001BD1160E|nr:hypothetical protein [Acidovorax sp. CCYZU-2555]MBS7779054.1 hypothetical protein [Acidovorax sp. CCYZU-2555]
MSSNTPADNAQKAADATKDLVNNAAEAAKEGVNATRKVASEAVDKAQEGLEAAQKQINPVIDDLAARAQELANRSIHFCADSSERARRQIQSAAEATNRYVVDQPAKSLMLAAAAGAAVATALLWGSRSRH